MARKYVSVGIHPGGHGVHTERTIIKCDNPPCQNQLRMCDAYGFAGTFVAMTGPRMVNPIAVQHLRAAGRDVEDQDFCCSLECAVAAHAVRLGHFAAHWREMERDAPLQVPQEADDTAAAVPVATVDADTSSESVTSTEAAPKPARKRAPRKKATKNAAGPAR